MKLLGGLDVHYVIPVLFGYGEFVFYWKLDKKHLAHEIFLF